MKKKRMKNSDSARSRSCRAGKRFARRAAGAVPPEGRRPSPVSAEERLRESEDNYRAILDASRDIIYTVNAAGVVTYMNRAAEAYGYLPGEIIGRRAVEFAHPDDRPMLQRAVAHSFATGQTLPALPYRIRKKDGSYFYAEQKSGVILKDGRPFQISCVVRDVSERRQLEAQLKEAETKYNALFEGSTSAVFLADMETGAILDVNRRAESLTGRTRGELIGMNKALLHPRGNKAFHEPPYAGGTEEETFASDEAVVLAKDGTRIPVRISASALEIGGRKMLLGIFEDITERKWEEDALRTHENKYRALVETTDTGYLILDRRGRVMDANREYVRLTGRDGLNDIIGKNVLEWTAPDQIEKNAAAVAACAKTGRVRNLVIDYTDKAGRVTTVEINATAEGKGDSLRIISLCRDITKLKKMESELALARAFEAVSLETRPIAHDFNNALTAINGYAALIDEDLDAASPIKPEIAMILKAVQRAAKIARKLQKYARDPKPRSGKPEA